MKKDNRNQRRSFLGRLLCCAPKSSSATNDRQINMVVPSNSSFMLTKKASFGSFRLPPPTQSAPDQTALLSKTKSKKFLALDLDETLVHSSFQPVDNASFVISVVIEGVVHNVFVIKRPGVDEFLERLQKHYEVSFSNHFNKENDFIKHYL